MEEYITKEDLRRFGIEMLDGIRKLQIEKAVAEKEELEPQWIKSRKARKLLDMSPGSLQNLRVTGKVRNKKVLGSYYYNKSDLLGLFDNSSG